MRSEASRDILRRLLPAENAPSGSRLEAEHFARLLETKDILPPAYPEAISRILRLAVREYAVGIKKQP